MKSCLSKRAIVWIVSCAILYMWPAAYAHSGDYNYPDDEIQAEAPDLGSASEYLNSSENRPLPKRRVIVVKSDETILKVGMADDLSVTPVPGRMPAPGEARFVQPPLRQQIVLRGGLASGPERAAVQYPATPRVRRTASASRIEVGMGDDLAVSPLPRPSYPYNDK